MAPEFIQARLNRAGKFEFSKFKVLLKTLSFGTFEIWSFEIVSSFGFRASDLNPLERE